jgi:small conductance mechanosensitive channel
MNYFSAKDLTMDLAIRYGFQVVGALAILGVGLLVARWVGNVTDGWLQKRALEPPARRLMVRGVRVVVMIFALVVALDKFGFQIAPLVAGIGVAGLGIGIALQGVLSNVMAGLTIIFTKPFRVGEYIQVVGVHGQVSAIELFSTTLLHYDRSRVVIPNRKIVGEILHNYGHIRQLDLRVDVAFAADIERALGAARGAVEADPRTLREPAPVIAVAGLTDARVTLAVKPWVAVDHEVAASGDLNRTILERIRAAGIEVPLSRHEIRMLA